MRWEGEVKHAELTPVRVWSKRDEGNFGGRSLFDEDNFLSHHGIPGMKWGVRTKEYVKKGYDTLKRRMAIQKMQRKAEAKAHYNEGYERGKRVAANTYFIKNKVQKVLDKKAEQKKERFTDKMVDKAFNKVLEKTGVEDSVRQYARQFGLEQHVDTGLNKARDMLKNLKDNQIDNLLDFMRTDKGKDLLQKAATFIGKGAYKVASVGELVAPYARKGLSYAGQAVKSGLKTGLKATGRGVVNTFKSGYKWARTGTVPISVQRMRNASRFISKYGRRASEYGQKAYDAAKVGMRSANTGLRAANNSLNDLLSRRLRRR